MDTHSCLLALLIFFVHIFIIHVQCQPYKYTTQKQACGDKLADIMSLVCSGRGYNVAFIPQEGRRTRRGIVEECCRNSCTQDILELYCRPEIPESPPNVQIKKRSDNDKSWSSEEEVISVRPTQNSNSKEETNNMFKPTRPTGGFLGVLTSSKTEIPNTIADLFNKEATQRTIQEKLNSLYQDRQNHKNIHNVIFHSSNEMESDNDKKLVETNNLGYILNEFSKEDTNIVRKENTKRPSIHEHLSDPIRHRHSKKTLHRHQPNKVPVKNAEEDNSAAFQIGVRMPYYSGRKQSRPRSGHSYSALI